MQNPGEQQNKKAFVGLSGGVDSAVSAALLKSHGYDVTGVFIRIAISGYPCPAAQDRIDAMRVAAHLKIPFKEVDLSKEYEQEVFRPSIEEFAKGRTPNPDTLCNEKIKFGIFFAYCMQEGADFVATGHYAQTKNGNLYVSADSNKDQSYFLWAVPETVLSKTLFPVGGLHKPDVRKLAEKFGLPNSDRPDSQGLCFLGDIGLDDMLAREVPQQPGSVLNEQGESVGTHRGAIHYTVGQRHGFELTIHTSTEVPHFVVSKDSKANTITVSTERFPKHKHAAKVILIDTNWIGELEEGPCEARFRYRQKLIPAEITKAGDVWQVTLKEPHFVPEGQSLVLYRGDRCLGGGVIASATLE
ncbi:MAG: tRNA 2-thiouridine(34) synthase MnmA [Candidatus Pacebacteria bacterium]|nr:tRNA 2-thiouridine(34) synthase MnmA [Candidatus Paceibacterota bacterium]